MFQETFQKVLKDHFFLKYFHQLPFSTSYNSPISKWTHLNVPSRAKESLINIKYLSSTLIKSQETNPLAYTYMEAKPNHSTPFFGEEKKKEASIKLPTVSALLGTNEKD